MITGVILAGGQSRRMGGGDKALMDLAGRPMIAHIIARFAPQVAALALNANGDARRFGALGLPVIGDTVASFPGPLAGVLAGMRWTAEAHPEAGHVATCAADTPLIPSDLVARLAEGIDTAAAIALARSAGHRHPVIGLWPVALADDLEAALRGGVRKVMEWAARHGVADVAFPLDSSFEPPIDPFFNANTPDELAQLDAVLRAHPQ